VRAHLEPVDTVSSTPAPSAQRARQVVSLQRRAGNSTVARLAQRAQADGALGTVLGPSQESNVALAAVARHGERLLQRAPSGLASPKRATAYTKSMVKLRDSWTSLTKKQRADALIAPANAALAKLGVEPVGCDVNPMGLLTGTDTRAAFQPLGWMVWFSEEALKDEPTLEEFGQVANSTYHECRHAEQTFRVARKLATEGLDARAIATALGIAERIAVLARAKPLKRKPAHEWDEAGKWQLNIQIEPGKGSSLAEFVNTLKDDAFKGYHKARTVLRSWQRAVDGDPTADPDTRKLVTDLLRNEDGAARVEAVTEKFRTTYIHAREGAKGAFKQYASMPIEADAWATGGLIQSLLRLAPTTAESELKNLDADEMKMIDLRAYGLTHNSGKERQLAKLSSET
jgi:hypothetical protein